MIGTVMSVWSIIYIEGSQVIIYEKYGISFFEDQFCLSKQCSPDEMLHYAAFHLGLLCLPKYLFRGFMVHKGFCMLGNFKFFFVVC